MNKRQYLSSLIMCIVSALLLIGFTIAWYSGNNEIATITRMDMMAAQTGTLTIALTPGGDDISVLSTNDVQGDEYALIGVDEFENTDGKLAPGTYGKITFYLTPESMDIQGCDIVPVFDICQEDLQWYLDEVDAAVTEDLTEAATEDTVEEIVASTEENTVTKEELYELLSTHIEFYLDEEMTQKIDDENVLSVDWDENREEKKAVIYWKWHYEYPFSADEESLTDDEKNEKIKAYDEEDMLIGENLYKLRVRVSFKIR